jgi:N-acetylmuramoyl-L-alanine amidase
MRKIGLCLSALFVCLLLVGLGQGKAEKSPQPPIQLILDGSLLVPDVPPKLIQGRTLVPVRVIAEGLGAEVGWDQAERRVDIVTESAVVSMNIGSQKAVVNGEEVVLDVPPIIDRGRTLVPLRFIGESLGATVGWEQETYSVVVNETYSMHANGKFMEQALNPIFKLGEELYFPLQTIAPFVGAVYQKANKAGVDSLLYKSNNLELKGGTVAQLKLRKMDIGWIVPQSALQDLFGADVLINQEESAVVINKISELLSVRAEGEHLYIETTEAMEPAHFLMVGPHRLVIDIPNTVMSKELKTASLLKEGKGYTGKSLETLSMSTLQDNNDLELLKEPDSAQQGGEVQEGHSKMTTSAQQTEGLAETTEIAEEIEDDSVIEQIRYSQFSLEPQTVRVVVDLSRKSNYIFSQTDTGYQVELKPLPRKIGYLVLLDAGHGGKDPGAIGTNGNYEKDFTLTMSKLIKEELQQYDGLQVIETRTDDSYPTLQDRAQFANDVEADLFLSIHANAFKPQTRGTETFYYTPQSESLARVVQKHLLEATGFPDRGVKKAGFVVIKNTNMPSSLIEVGFLSNQDENKMMQQSDFQQKVAEAMGKAIFEYYTSYN